MTSPSVILPLTTFGNTFFCHFLMRNRVVIDLGENYPKQTWRNRYDILGGNGPISLTIPVVGQKGAKTPVHQIEIDNETDWQSHHWKTLCSAYASAPYFEHYAPELEPLFKKRFNRLVEFNLAALKLLADWLETEERWHISDAYCQPTEHQLDLRPFFKPSRFNPDWMVGPSYTQVFSERFEFKSNCSVLDTIFNLGPEAHDYLAKIEMRESQITILGR